MRPRSVAKSLILITVLYLIVVAFVYEDLINQVILSRGQNQIEESSLEIVEDNEVVIYENRGYGWDELTELEEEKFAVKPKPGEIIKIMISLAGDVTIGTDINYGYNNSFIHEVERQNNNFEYFIENSRPIFEYDDLTLVNLETTLTSSSKKANKKFTFKGDPKYAEILKLASIEAVNIANNHIYDYLDQGFEDTIESLNTMEIGFFGYEYKYATKIKGITIGALGYEGWKFSDELQEQIKRDLTDLNQNTDLIIVSFHWGNENQAYPEEDQINLARYTIDHGADLVFGHHPHVVQGIETYRDKYIVYSLGNFLYGGHRNPSDKETFIFQQTFYFNSRRNLLPYSDTKIIPFSISSVNYRNDYRPTPLKGEDKERFEKRIEKLSVNIN